MVINATKKRGLVLQERTIGVETHDGVNKELSGEVQGEQTCLPCKQREEHIWRLRDGSWVCWRNGEQSV